MIDIQNNIITLCKTSQCKKKQWCKRYQLYMQRYQLYVHKSKSLDMPIQHLEIPWISIINSNDFNILEHEELCQLIDTCEYFIPTEQYAIKERLDKLSRLDNY